MTWIPIRPFALLFHLKIPGTAPRGWTAELITPEACAGVVARNQLPVYMAVARVRASLSGKPPMSAARLATIASRLLIRCRINSVERASLDLFSLPVHLIVEQSIASGAVVEPDDFASGKAAAALFPPEEHSEKVPEAGDYPRWLRLLEMRDVIELELAAPNGLADGADVEASIALMGYHCEHSR